MAKVKFLEPAKSFITKNGLEIEETVPKIDEKDLSDIESIGRKAKLVTFPEGSKMKSIGIDQTLLYVQNDGNKFLRLFHNGKCLKDGFALLDGNTQISDFRSFIKNLAIMADNGIKLS